jgi:hypothetical protein
MSFFYPDLHRRSPVRPLAWRWQRADALVGQGRYFCRRRDAAQTGRTVRYLRALERCRTGLHKERLARAFLDVHDARLLHEDNGARAVEVQARLLARQSVDVIARAAGLPLDVVGAYEALFFNVLDRLDASDWITAQAVGWHRFDPAKGRDRATVLKAYAYHGGPLVLETVLPYLLNGRLEAAPSPDLSAADARLDRSVRLALGIDLMPWTAGTALTLMRMHAYRLEAERQVSHGQAHDQSAADVVAKMLEHLCAVARADGAGRHNANRDADASKRRQTA